MTNEPVLPDSTLISPEMPDFYAGGPYTVGRDYGGQAAHIYAMSTTRSLCGRHFRTRYSRLAGYAAGDKTCKRCLTIYRRRAGGKERRST